jgi:hypothetical protein
LILGDERARVIEQMEEQVQELRGEIERLSMAQDAVAGAIDEKRTEPIGGARHRCLSLPARATSADDARVKPSRSEAFSRRALMNA